MYFHQQSQLPRKDGLAECGDISGKPGYGGSDRPQGRDRRSKRGPEMIEGRVWKLGDHINTDLIIPGRYLDDYSAANLSAHVLEDTDPQFVKQVRKGDVIVAGRNFGCGSSREQAPLALKYAGVGAVVAGSFARIFFRNAINISLPVVVCPKASQTIQSGDVVRIDLKVGSIEVVGSGQKIKFNPMPDFLMSILQSGGLVPYTRERLHQK
jgi:3-isopropylmalate dehydratase small subunit